MRSYNTHVGMTAQSVCILLHISDMCPESESSVFQSSDCLISLLCTHTNTKRTVYFRSHPSACCLVDAVLDHHSFLARYQQTVLSLTLTEIWECHCKSAKDNLTLVQDFQLDTDLIRPKIYVQCFLSSSVQPGLGHSLSSERQNKHNVLSPEW